jgi:hypothetical protein
MSDQKQPDHQITQGSTQRLSRTQEVLQAAAAVTHQQSGLATISAEFLTRLNPGEHPKLSAFNRHVLALADATDETQQEQAKQALAGYVYQALLDWAGPDYVDGCSNAANLLTQKVAAAVEDALLHGTGQGRA